MKKVLLLLTIAISSTAFADAEIKEVCKDKVDKEGKPVMKAGKFVQDCKKIKVHKKLEGTKVPVKK
jgi:ligand-binding sensor protein